jgi:hypothetical protein
MQVPFRPAYLCPECGILMETFQRKDEGLSPFYARLWCAKCRLALLVQHPTTKGKWCHAPAEDAR